MSLKRYGLRLSTLTAALLLSACGSGGGDDQPNTPQDPPPGTETPTVEQQISQLETAGEIPVLDQGDSVTVDSTSGVREDVARYIAANFNANPGQQAAAMQLAQAIQQQIEVDKNSEEAVQAVLQQTVRALVCLTSRVDASSTPSVSTIVQEIGNITANTNNRLDAYLAFSQILNGAVVSLPNATGDECND